VEELEVLLLEAAHREAVLPDDVHRHLDESDFRRARERRRRGRPRGCVGACDERGAECEERERLHERTSVAVSKNTPKNPLGMRIRTLFSVSENVRFRRAPPGPDDAPELPSARAPGTRRGLSWPLRRAPFARPGGPG